MFTPLSPARFANTPLRRCSRSCSIGSAVRSLSRPWFLISVALGALPTTSRGEPIDFVKIEFPPIGYVQGTAHIGSAEGAHDHAFLDPCVDACGGIGPDPCAVWGSPFSIGETTLRMARLWGFSQHTVAAHPGETECNGIFVYNMAVSVPLNGVIRHDRREEQMSHGDHTDVHVIALAAFSLVFPGGYEKRGYVHGSLGVHRPRPPIHNRSMAATLSGHSQVPPGTSSAFGCLVLSVDDVDGNLSLFMMIDSIQPHDILAAQVHLGQPEENGPPVFFLGGQAEFSSNGQGSSLSLLEVPFPVELLPWMLGDQTYVNICTVGAPSGEIRGQIEAIASQPAAVPNPAERGSGGAYAYPRPASREATIAFRLAESEKVSLEIVDATGRRVRRLWQDEMGAGEYEVRWDLRSDEGGLVPSGVYYYRLLSGSLRDSGPIVIAR